MFFKDDSGHPDAKGFAFVLALPIIKAALRAYGDQREREALERAAKAIYNAEAGGDCEYNKGGGPDGGCSLRGDCLCGHWNEALDKAKAKVLALIPKGPAND